MDNFIFQPSSLYSKTDNQDLPTDENFYTLLGSEDFTDDESNPRTNSDKHTYAKKIIRKDGTIKYMIKLDSTGKLYNPVSIYGQEKNKSFLDRICRSNTKFREVNNKVFDWYLKFLKTKNIAWLANAEREGE